MRIKPKSGSELENNFYYGHVRNRCCECKNVDVLIVILLLNNTSRPMDLDYKCSRSNPVPPVYLYSALVQLLSTLIVDQ